MAQYGGFFNSGTTEENQRKYNDYDFAKMLSLLTGGEGYVVGYGNELEVTDASDSQLLRVEVGSGAAWVGNPEGWWFANDPEEGEDSHILSIAPLGQVESRNDKVVVRLDRSTGVQNFKLHIIEDGDSNDEFKTDDLKAEHMYDLLLAEVEVTKDGEDTSIVIKDRRVPCINSQSTTIEKTVGWTLGLSDMHKFIRVNSSSSVDISMPLDSDVSFPINTEIVIVQHGTGTININPASGVTVHSASGLKSSGQYSGFTLRKIATDEWYALGSLTE